MLRVLKLTSVHCVVMIVASFSVTSLNGCASLKTPRLSLPEKKVEASPSSIAQLGTALPAMKPGDDRELCLIAADQMSEAGHWDEAVELYLKAESLARKKPKLDAKLAPAFAGAGKYAESIARYRKLIDDASQDAELRNNFAWTLMESGDFAGAEREFRAAMTLSPNEPRAAVNLGVLLARQKRYDEALAILTASLGEPAAHHNIGVIAIEAGDEVTALRAFEKAASMPGAPKASVEFVAALKSETVTPQVHR